jgi:general secretion pathway protein D
MNKPQVVLVCVLLLAGITSAISQVSPAERRLVRQYISPEELVSIAPSTPMDRALAAISEVSQKFIGKIIIDTDRRSLPINVDIQAMHWRDALDAICRKNNVWYTEYENYIQITGTTGIETAVGGQAGQAGTIQREFATLKSREIKISAVVFEVNLTKLEEVGVDWTFMKSTSNLNVDLALQGSSKQTNFIFQAGITPKLSFANINIIANLFSEYQLGEILSGPQVTVRSGEQGRIQVGQDFSIKERDFSGNLIDKFYSAGTIVVVTPQVVTEQGVNFIHLVAEVERSSVVPGTITTIINKTKANTNVLLLDSEETIIGGLYNSEVSTVRAGIPFLKDLPWYVLGLRYLFGYNRDEVVKKELVILLKAELVPTLQERITQKAAEGSPFERWRDENLKEEARIRGGEFK